MDGLSQYNFGLYCQKIKNEINAFKYFEKSAKQEHSEAQNYLGYYYENGIGIQKDLKKAFYWYQKSAENGNKFAQYNLISYYLNGWKIEEKLAKQEIEQKNDKMQYKLGYFYEIQNDLKKSFYWYQKSAENNNKFAQYNLGLYYQNGWGIEKTDEIEAFKWYEKSAKQDNSDAQNYLGFLYNNGINIQKDLEKSFYWYQKSAENGNMIAQYNLSNFYRYGLEIEKNEIKAKEWYKKLAGPDNKFFIENDELINTYNIDSNINDNDNNPFNNIQFNEPIINANCEANSEFITVKATIFPGISDTSYSEAEKLQKLLISRKDDIDHILELQPVYAIGVDFQKNSTRPCIACWVAKLLDITVLECLETVFEDQFEVIYKIVAPLNINENNNQNLNTSNYFANNEENLKDEDGNDSNNGNSNGGSSGSNNRQNGNNNNNNGNNSNSNAGNSGNNMSNNDSGDSGNNNYGGDDDDDGDGDDNNSGKKKVDRIYISSKVNAKVINSEFLQDFNISTNLWAEIIPFEENIKILEYDVDVNVCGVGDMLSNQCPLLNGKGLGYLLHSVEVHVSPLPNNGNNLFGLKGTSQPRQINQNIEISKGNEKSYEGKVGISKTPGVDFTGGYKKSNNIQYSSNEWKLFYKGPNTKGECWLYQYIDNDLDKDVLRCEITRGWRRFLPNTKTLLQKFPIMAHNLNVTFNDLEDFNSKLKSLNKTCYYNSDDIGVIVGSNENENKIVNKPQNIQNLVGKIDRSLGLK
ncbi:HCP-like protein [Rhizophagus irregularis]|uniref:HCP-like protein n=1 Tax=Rhizophagus irregularis TaxID=588596 RepID=A0A2N0PRJ2_9GLOM|nr:HCP-like protein [Rhizophagus irregularis]